MARPAPLPETIVPTHPLAGEAAAALRDLAAAGGPVLVLGHFDADGLSATAILLRALRRAGREAEARIVGKGEGAWSPEIAAEVESRAPAAVIVADLGTRGEAVAGRPTLVLDHHVPDEGWQAGPARVVSGHGADPEPTSALLAWWAARGVAEVDDLLWLAGLGLVGDMAEEAGFPEMAAAQRGWGKTALRNAASLVNAPRRTAAADASPALALLLRCEGPKEVLSGAHPETAVLEAAKAEVRLALEAARRVPPKVRGDVALVRIDAPQQVHPLVAQAWRGRLADKVVIVANTGYRPGWVHLAARTATGADLVAFMALHRPPGVAADDPHYGHGHPGASGGALRLPDWNDFATALGYPEDRL